MPLDVHEIEARVVAEVGDPNSSLWAYLTTIEPIITAKEELADDLGFLYAKRAAIDVRLAEEQASTDVTLDNSALLDKQSQRFDHLQAMRQETQAEIVRIELSLRARRGGAIAALSTAAPPRPAYSTTLDRNDPRYQGDPYLRGREW